METLNELDENTDSLTKEAVENKKLVVIVGKKAFRRREVR